MPSASSSQSGAELDLLGLGREVGARGIQRVLLLLQRRGLRVELRLLLVECGELLGARAGGDGLIAGSRQLRLRRVELCLAGIQLRLTGVELLLPVRDLGLRVGELLRLVLLLLLGVERVEHRRDVLHVFGALRDSPRWPASVRR